MKVYYTDQFHVLLPEQHTFPMAKYARLRQRVVESNLVASNNLVVPHAATDEELLRVHASGYLQRVQRGLLTTEELRALGLPWSVELVERSKRSCGATIEACRSALEDGTAVNLAGGTHHASRDHGAGYCLFNDAAVAARAMLAEGRVRRIVILDCDVHQGDGTASIFATDPAVFTFSIHGENNYPPHKPPSDLDIGLADGVGDSIYLDALDQGVRLSLDQAGAELAIYLAGADPFADDRLGRLAVSKQGLAERDRLIFGYCRAAGLPVAVAMAGGYGRDIEDTVEIHLQTVREAISTLGFPCPTP